jgi:hypothetical protein
VWNVDGVRLKGRRGEVEGSGHTARVFPYCQELFGTIDAGYDTLSAKKDSRLCSVSGRACTKELENDMISLQRQPQPGKVEGDTQVSGCQVIWTSIRESYYYSFSTQGQI